MRIFTRIICAVLSIAAMLSLSGCETPEEKEKRLNKMENEALRLAEEYFDDAYEYDFNFYGGGGEGDPSVYIYVFKNGDKINCISIPAKENAPGPYVYYDCQLHQYSGGQWSLLDYEDSESTEK